MERRATFPDTADTVKAMAGSDDAMVRAGAATVTTHDVNANSQTERFATATAKASRRSDDSSLKLVRTNFKRSFKEHIHGQFVHSQQLLWNISHRCRPRCCLSHWQNNKLRFVLVDVDI